MAEARSGIGVWVGRAGTLLRMVALLPAAAAVEVLLRTRPLAEAVAAVGGRLGIDDAAAPPGPPPLDVRSRRWVHAARRLTDLWPTRGRCLRRALLTTWLVRRHRPVVRIGACRTEDRWQLHAWVEVGGVPLEGGVDRYRVVWRVGVG